MKTSFYICFIISSLAFSLGGCSKQENVVIQVKGADDPFTGIRPILERYVSGQHMNSEVTSFPDFITKAKKANPEKGAILEKGLGELQKPGANLKSKARELLEKLK